MVKRSLLGWLSTETLDPKRPYLSRFVRRVAHGLRLALPFVLPLLLSTVVDAQGTMDFSGAQTLMGTFKTFAMYAGAVICLGGLIFAGIRMMSGRFQDAIPGLFGALVYSVGALDGSAL